MHWTISGFLSCKAARKKGFENTGTVKRILPADEHIVNCELMQLNTQLASHFRQMFFGGNWTWVNLKDTLADVDPLTAGEKPGTVHSISELVFHIHYYVGGVLEVLRGNPLSIKDQYSFPSFPLVSQEEWESLKQRLFTDAESLAVLLEQMPEGRFEEIFTNPKYGNYFRNILGLIEHTHYHLGQIVVIKNLLTLRAGT